jgi:hypothetical protein
MYSSSAHPTAIPSSDLVTRDLPAVDPRIGTRRQNTTAGLPLGLIPQLIDVLHILTEGQELLSHKIRTARLNESRDPVPIVEQIERFEIPAVRPIVDNGSATVEKPPTPPSEDIEFDGETTPANFFGMDRRSDPGIEAGGADIPPAGVPDSTSPSDSPAVTSADAMGDPSSASVVQSVPLDSVPPAETTTTSSLRRDYNFFDELDAKLASLQDPTS